MLPNFDKKSTLNTDESNVVLGAVLGQENWPSIFISITLNLTKRKYGTNEEELYTIVWALNLRNYLYNIKQWEIYTDH